MSINTTKIFIPACQKCNGYLNITINPLNFSIDYFCTNNNLHKDKNIYFKTFERFYLKEKELKHCSNCLICLENSEFFECNICQQTFCCRCHNKDIQVNGHKYKDNNYTNNRCKIHYNDFTEYCFNCNKNICISCLKSAEHINHQIVYYHNYMPSDNEIENLKIRIKEKSEFYEKLIKKIDDWNQKFNLKLEELKQNLKDEISFLEKITFNFNKNFRNYFYFQNFEYINKNINNTTNNQYLLEFYNSLSFEKQTEILITIFKFMRKKSFLKQSRIVNVKNILNNANFKFVEKINDNHFIAYNEFIKIIFFLFFNDNNDIIYPVYNCKILENVFSISKSTLENKIFICLSNNKVKIIDYDLKRNMFNLSEIIDNNNAFNNNNNHNSNYYYKCIQLSSGLYATSNNNIIIWTFKGNIYSKFKFINVNCAIYDMLLIDKDNFMCASSSNQNLIIYEIKTYLILKVIKNIDCRQEDKTLLKVNSNFILINCYNGIGIFDIKSYEIVQYTQEYYSQLKPIITLYSSNKIYITLIQCNQYNSNSNRNSNNIIVKMFVTEIKYGEIMLCEEYDNINSNDLIKNILYFNNKLLSFGNSIYTFTGKDSIFKC